MIPIVVVTVTMLLLPAPAILVAPVILGVGWINACMMGRRLEKRQLDDEAVTKMKELKP